MRPDRFTACRPSVDRLAAALKLWRWPLALAVLCIALQAAGLAPELRWQRSLIEAGQWWRLLTGSLVHLGWSHLAMDLAGLALIWALFGPLLSTWQWTVAFLTSASAVGLGLYLFDPQLAWYVGLSGALHGLFVAALPAQFRKHPGEGLILLAAIAAKLTWEHLLGPLPGSAELAGGAVVTQAHLAGALGGLVYALTHLALSRARIPREVARPR
ncbi:MAG: rhombosortase [Gammaproteobacteria bacterium]